MLKIFMEYCKLPSTDLLFQDHTLYKSIVRALQYRTITCSVIIFAVNSVCSICTNHAYLIFKPLSAFFGMLKGHSLLGFVMLSVLLLFTVYSDADWAGDSIN